jgi:hypothetical protein
LQTRAVALGANVFAVDRLRRMHSVCAGIAKQSLRG